MQLTHDTSYYKPFTQSSESSSFVSINLFNEFILFIIESFPTSNCHRVITRVSCNIAVISHFHNLSMILVSFIFHLPFRNLLRHFPLTVDTSCAIFASFPVDCWNCFPKRFLFHNISNTSDLSPAYIAIFLHGFTSGWGKTPHRWKMNYLMHLP